MEVDIDLETPSLARVHDAQLGGSGNFRADRRLAEDLERVLPGASRSMQAGRQFLTRAVRYCARRGIDQFLDVGTVHGTTAATVPGAHLVRVDADPIAVLGSRAALAGDPRTGVVRGDPRHPEAILDDPVTRRLIDFDRPVAVLALALLHTVADVHRPEALVARLTARCAPGSCLVLTHFGARAGSREQFRAVTELTLRSRTPVWARSAEQVRTLLGGFEPVAPGVVVAHRWRPDHPGAAHSAAWAAVGVLPARGP